MSYIQKIRGNTLLFQTRIDSPRKGSQVKPWVNALKATSVSQPTFHATPVLLRFTMAFASNPLLAISHPLLLNVMYELCSCMCWIWSIQQSPPPFPALHNPTMCILAHVHFSRPLHWNSALEPTHFTEPLEYLILFSVPWTPSSLFTCHWSVSPFRNYHAPKVQCISVYQYIVGHKNAGRKIHIISVTNSSTSAKKIPLKCFVRIQTFNNCLSQTYCKIYKKWTVSELFSKESSESTIVPWVY